MDAGAANAAVDAETAAPPLAAPAAEGSMEPAATDETNSADDVSARAAGAEQEEQEENSVVPQADAETPTAESAAGHPVPDENTDSGGGTDENPAERDQTP